MNNLEIVKKYGTLIVPVVALGAFALYKLALEVWCIAYGLIY